MSKYCKRSLNIILFVLKYECTNHRTSILSKVKVKKKKKEKKKKKKTHSNNNMPMSQPCSKVLGEQAPISPKTMKPFLFHIFERFS